MIGEREPRTAEPSPASPAPPPARRLRPATVFAAAVLAAALAGGGVAAAVTGAVLQSRARTNPQSVDLHNNVTISATDAVTNVAAKALPAVVSIVTGTAPDGTPASGSGFLVTSDGYIVTGVPVVTGSTRLTVLVPGDSRPHPAHVVDYDCPAGFAVLKADGVTGAPTLGFGDSSALREGETVVALGGRLQGPQVAATVVAALNSLSSFPDPADASRRQDVGAAIVTGNRLLAGAAGAPLLNVGGQVVGVLLPAPAGSPSAAVAAAMISPGVQAVVTGGQLQVAGFGAHWSDLTSEQAALAGRPQGAVLTALDPAGPAAQAGLKAGDLITAVDDVAVGDPHPLELDLRTRFQPGQRVTLTYARGSGSGQVQLTLDAERPACT